MSATSEKCPLLRGFFNFGYCPSQSYMLPDSALECKHVNSIEIKGVTPGLNLGQSSQVL